MVQPRLILIVRPMKKTSTVSRIGIAIVAIVWSMYFIGLAIHYMVPGCECNAVNYRCFGCGTIGTINLGPIVEILINYGFMLSLAVSVFVLPSLLNHFGYKKN